MASASSLSVVLFALLVATTFAQDCRAHYENVTQHTYMYFTTKSVTGDASYINSVEPPIGFENLAYLYPVSCLGHYGPIGSNGPLGQYGPLGDDSWSPATWISGMGWDWHSWVDKISGPLSIKGPLGPNGPVSDHWYNDVCPCINSFAHQLMNGGVFSILGPLGPMGALGPLGALGRIGAHGYARNDNGQYVTKGGRVMRTVSVPYSATTNRTFSLYEEYAHHFALTTKNSLDTSWYVRGVQYNNTDPAQHTYVLTSTDEQFIYVLVVPYTLVGWAFPPSFVLTVNAGKGDIVSDPSMYIPWVIVKVPAGKTKVVLSVSGDAIAETMAYSLYVTGSTSYFPKTDIVGDFQQF